MLQFSERICSNLQNHIIPGHKAAENGASVVVLLYRKNSWQSEPLN